LKTEPREKPASANDPPPRRNRKDVAAALLAFLGFGAAWVAVAWLLAGADPTAWPLVTAVAVGLGASATAYLMETANPPRIVRYVAWSAFGLTTASGALAALLYSQI
jgi:hypothetical protein